MQAWATEVNFHSNITAVTSLSPGGDAWAGAVVARRLPATPAVRASAVAVILRAGLVFPCMESPV